MSSFWAPPTAQQYPARSYQPVDVLMDRIRKLEGLVAELTKGSPLRQAGIGVAPGQVEFNGDAVFAGDTSVTGNLDVAGTAAFSGDTTIGGNLDVTGTLNLPAGIIGNDALATPLDFRASWANADAFSITSTASSKAASSVTVPAGFTRAVVQVFGMMEAINRGAASNFLRANCRVTSPSGAVWPGRQLITSIGGSNGVAALTVMVQRDFTGLTGGGTIIGEVLASADLATLAADPFNACTVSMLATFSR